MSNFFFGTWGAAPRACFVKAFSMFMIILPSASVSAQDSKSHTSKANEQGRHVFSVGLIKRKQNKSNTDNSFESNV
jgi:hypothetical protein